MTTVLAETRPARSADAEGLAALHEASWREAYRGLIPHRALSAMIERRGPDWWRRAIDASSAILVLHYGDALAGYATIGRNRTAALRAGGEIYELYLQPEFQGIGFGRLLFDEARAALASHRFEGLVVWALEDNERAMGFYAAMGGTDVASGAEAFDGKRLSKVAFLWS